MAAHLSSYAPSTSRPNTTQSVRHNPLSPQSSVAITDEVEYLTQIIIPIKIECCQDEKYNDNFSVSTAYRREVTVGKIIKIAIDRLNKKHDPLTFHCIAFLGISFISHANAASSVKNPITNYNKKHLTSGGMKIQVVINKYEHKIEDIPITCKYMLSHYRQHHQFIPESCPIYNKMKNQYDHQTTYLLHLKNYNHFFHQFNDKPACRYADQCFAFQRLEENGYNFTDLCHIQLYRHPPRQNTLNLKANMKSLAINTKNDENYPIYEPTEADKKNHEYDEKNGYLKALIQEVIKNGYEECLHLDEYDGDEDEEYSLLCIVNDKLHSLRHKQMLSPLNRAQMLSIVLYTGTDCNYLMCKKQRNGDYDTWKWFDYCLFNAIRLLSIHETAEYILYSGLKKVKLDKRIVNQGFFKTYTSSSWKLSIARKFMDSDSGMIIVMDKEFRKHTYCCDVSWISKFPDECEVLISRSFGGENHFSLKVMDNLGAVQIVSLFFKP